MKTWYTNVDSESSQGLVTEEDTGKNIAVTYDAADAPLVAAAPDLLEALEILTDHAEERYPHFERDRGQKDIRRAWDAIQKARGE